MSFRRAFIGFALGLAVPGAALAQEARQIELGYEITFAGISGFRIDPHEFASPTGFFVKRVKLAALEKAAASYTVRWTSSKWW